MLVHCERLHVLSFVLFFKYLKFRILEKLFSASRVLFDRRAFSASESLSKSPDPRQYQIMTRQIFSLAVNKLPMPYPTRYEVRRAAADRTVISVCFSLGLWKQLESGLFNHLVLSICFTLFHFE